MRKVVVLSDGETYTDIDGCRVVSIPDDVDDEDIERYLKDHPQIGEQVSGEIFITFSRPRHDEAGPTLGPFTYIDAWYGALRFSNADHDASMLAMHDVTSDEWFIGVHEEPVDPRKEVVSGSVVTGPPWVIQTPRVEGEPFSDFVVTPVAYPDAAVYPTPEAWLASDECKRRESERIWEKLDAEMDAELQSGQAAGLIIERGQ